MVTFGKLLVLHAEPPVRIAGRKPTARRNGIQLIGVDQFEDRGKEIEPVVAGVFLHFDLDLRQLGRQFAKIV